MIMIIGLYQFSVFFNVNAYKTFCNLLFIHELELLSLTVELKKRRRIDVVCELIDTFSLNLFIFFFSADRTLIVLEMLMLSP